MNPQGQGAVLPEIDDDLRHLLDMAWETRQRYFDPVLGTDYPKRTTAVSVTGTGCALNCAHCSGHYLQGMTPLGEFVGKEHTGTSSLLVSGGCDGEGKVPLLAHLDAIAHLERHYRLNIHPGLLEAQEAAVLGPLATVVSFDLVGDDDTIREVYGLDRTVEDYRRTYRELRKYARVIPHLCLGIHGGEFRGEYRALEMLKEEGAEALVLLVFIPTRGTPFADRRPPDLRQVVRFLTEARLTLPETPLYLGCMRPGGRYREWLDMLAVRAGVNRIVIPAKVALALAEGLGLKFDRGEECCAF